jgi:hypothetical protein
VPLLPQCSLTHNGCPVSDPIPTDFPRAPVPALASLLSPFAWVYGRPDLFDSYSAGVLLMQMVGGMGVRRISRGGRERSMMQRGHLSPLYQSLPAACFI